MTLGVSFNNTHCNTLNLLMGTPKRPLLPETKDTYIDIPHKDGSILIPDKSARDIMVEVPFLLKSKRGSNIFDDCRRISAWLLTDSRQPLIFDDDPEYYYNAKVVGNVDLEKVIKSRKFTVVFRCEPYMKKVTP